MEPLQTENGFLPARMINEFVYCARLFWLEYVEREFEESFDTVDGTHVHRKVDKPGGELPDDVSEMKRSATSVELASPSLGVVAKIDIVDSDGAKVIPIDYKRGRVPEVPLGAYDPERVQVCIQALLLRENGYSCDVGRLYYAGSKRYVDIPIDAELIEQTRIAIEDARMLLAKPSIPKPLVDSPKCMRCSLHAICMPDETLLLREGRFNREIRPFAAPSVDRVPLYVLEPGARIGLRGETLEIKKDNEVQASMPLLEVAHASVFGNAQISSQAMRALLGRDVPVFYLSYGGWLNGYARSINDHSLDLRIAQHAIAQDPERALKIARAFIYGKIKNQRTMVRRALGDDARDVLQALSYLLHRIDHVRDSSELLGMEGAAAQRYFE
ncbi:MAG: CRISPR-associated endonuclease Cas1, partial [Vulcanimicrobiaceae bacterium]